MVDTFKLVSKRTGLFNNFSEEEFQSIISQASPIEFEASELIVREGELGDALYIIVRGQADVFTVTQAGEEILLAQLQEGEYFGEQSLLLESPQKRNASVRAHSNS